MDLLRWERLFVYKMGMRWKTRHIMRGCSSGIGKADQGAQARTRERGTRSSGLGGWRQPRAGSQGCGQEEGLGNRL